MNYTDHFTDLKSNFPELDLLNESEFNIFENQEFASSFTKYCLKLCNNARNILGIDLLFGIQFNQQFNASAIVKYNQAAIIFNLGLIDKLGIIISNSTDLFLSENIAQLTIKPNQRQEWNQVSIKCCISYLFYHELAHVIQLTGKNENKDYNFQELYIKVNSFKIINHVYEFDADLFGSMLSATELMKNVMNHKLQFNTILLFNSITSLLFTIGNIIIEFSGNLINDIYYLQNSHPHPFIRIIKLYEQILGNISANLNIENPFFETALQRASKMISQIEYSNQRIIDYANFYNKNSVEIEDYINNIEKENEKYKELTRFKSQDFFNNLIWIE